MKSTILPALLKFSRLISIPALLSLTTALSLYAQDKDYSGTCRITVLEIVADNSGQGLAQELKDLKKDLEKLNYNTYRLSNTYRVEISKSEQKSFTLVGDHQLSLTSEGMENGMLRLKVKLSPKSSKDKALETILRIPDGGTFLIGGPSCEKGVLILAFTATM